NHVRDTVTIPPPDVPDLPLPSFLSYGGGNEYATSRDEEPPGPQMGESETTQSRRSVKTYARRALKDFLAFLSHLEYTPHMPQEAVADFTEKIGQAASGAKNPRHGPGGGPVPPEVIYPISELFSATPPADLPAYP